ALGDAPRVVMMTVHGAKGLEFERVVLTGMEEEMFPYKGVDPGEHEELEEERRLAYVAITRARKRLFMTHTQTRQIFGTTRWNRPSRFLSELPRDAVEQVATAALGREGGRERYVDRGYAPAAARRAPAQAWHHPQQREAQDPPPEPGDRFVDHSFFDDQSHDVTDMPLRRGARVRHDRFGEGEVRVVTNVGEPAVVAFFPGWGEKKILARFLKPAG
ncbi:MAG: 3'-5' exonuclease, partial [Polyangiaceae bacterium]